MSDCKHAGEPMAEDFKGRFCKLTDKQLCWNYDKPELVQKCPVLGANKRVVT